MEIGVLGSLTVDGIAVVQGKQRTLLAVLAAGANRPVSHDRLTDAVWGVDVPSPGTVRWHVHQLRQLLGPDRLTKAGDRYLLTVGAHELDAARFESLNERARDARDPEEALSLAEAALGLWRGPAFAGVSELDAISGEALRLEELRLVAVGRRVEALLALDRAGECVAELTALLAVHPLRERVVRWLMSALYQDGRRAEALRVYRESRRALMDELGVEPGRALTRLHQEILRGEQPEAAPSRIAPAELPPSPGTFVGRSAEVRRLVEQRARVVAIDGSGGIGKTALAVHAAHLLADRFPDGQLYVNLHGFTSGVSPLAPAEVLGRFLRSLGVPDAEVPADLDEAANRFRSLTRARRILIVLDNAADVAQLRPLLPSGRECAVIVTSRRVLGALDGAARLHLGTLDDGAAMSLLAGGALIGAEPEAARQIVRRCAGLPLALRVVAARLASHPGGTLSALARSLDDAHHRLDELEHDDLAVKASFSASLQHLQPFDARLFATLGLLNAYTFTPGLAAALCGAARREVDGAFARLAEARLLDAVAPGRYGMHDLHLLYARDLASGLPAGEREAALSRAVHWYLATCRTVRALMGFRVDPVETESPGLPVEDAAEAIAWFDAEADNLVAAVPQLLAHAPAPATSLVRTIGTPLMHRGRAADVIRVAEALLDVAGDREREFIAHNLLGLAHQERGEPHTAAEHLTRGIALARLLDLPRAEATAATNLSVVCERLGRSGEAVDHARRAIELFRRIGHRLGEASALVNLGMVYGRQQRWAEDLAFTERGLAMFKELGAEAEISQTLGNLGHIHRMLGSVEQAMDCLVEAEERARRCGNRPGEAISLWGQGDVHLARGDQVTARRLWERAGAMLQDAGRMTAAQADALLSQSVPDLEGFLSGRS
ncbi:BTAD domain-containing putative transcriptional regulator [Nonomuraea sp. NPDC050556]|uniref:AfsR/SARP family transcriptional regulator n=1 Tax=Nonomuraea sp. NPDC050556 TaxID=3364369 RepID=UPI0037B72DC6